MAWRFRVEALDRRPDGTHLAIQFFDDTDSSVTIARELFTFPPGTTKAQAVATIKTRGSTLRDLIAQTDALAAQINPGDEGTV